MDENASFFSFNGGVTYEAYIITNKQAAHVNANTHTNTFSVCKLLVAPVSKGVFQVENVSTCNETIFKQFIMNTGRRHRKCFTLVRVSFFVLALAHRNKVCSDTLRAFEVVKYQHSSNKNIFHRKGVSLFHLLPCSVVVCNFFECEKY